MRQTLATALGQTVHDRKHIRKSVHYNKPVDVNRHSPVARRQNTHFGTELDVLECANEEQGEEGERSSGSTSSKSGPTPKRARPRKAFKAPEIRQPRISIMTSRNTVLHERRLPFRDVSSGRGNMSPIRIPRRGKGSPMKQDNWGQALGENPEVEADLGFGSEILFTSTPFTPEITKVMDGVDDYDDATLDE
jgi:hypothetical protein